MSPCLVLLLLCAPCVFPQESSFGGFMGKLFGHHRDNEQPVQGEEHRQATWKERLSHVVEQTVSRFSERKTDILNDLKELKSQPVDWHSKAEMLCSRFNGLCQNDHLPSFSQLGDMVQNVLSDPGKYLPKVPLISIKDPLAGINHELAHIAEAVHIDFGAISQFVKGTLLDVCKWINCHSQSAETVQLKNLIMKRLYEFEQKYSGKDQTVDVNLRADRTQQIKQALLQKAGMDHAVTAADNGVFDKDILLTESQQNFMLNELGKGGVGTAASSPTKDHKRSAVFFSEHPTQFWTLPIPYTFDSSLDDLDMNDVREALEEIEQKTCIKFEYTEDPWGPHITYLKVESDTFCGLSYIGRVEPANPVYLNFQCSNPKGVILHETMHTLGVIHQHLRPDRDRYITVDWSNVNPQHYDMFAVVDSKMFTSYGVKYAYDSIMHYDAYTGTTNPAKPTLIPKVDSGNLSQLRNRNELGSTDIEILNKMYCYRGCEDKNIFCGVWALQDLCSINIWVKANCHRSCDGCKRP